MAAASGKGKPTNENQPKCGAKTRGGRSCGMTAGMGTDHVGFGQCKHHGGSTPNGRKHASKQQAVALGAEMGIDPFDAIEKAIGGAHAWLEFCRQQVQSLDPSSLVIEKQRTREWFGLGENSNGAGTETIIENHAELHLWVRLYRDALKDLAQLAKVAIDAGLDARRVELAEQHGEQIAQVIQALYAIAEPHLTAIGKKLFREGVRTQLIALEGGAGA